MTQAAYALTTTPATELIRQATILDREIVLSAKRTLELARRAGEVLLQLKEVSPHGTFTENVALAGIPYPTAARYMKVAKKLASLKYIPWDSFAEMGIKEFLGYETAPKPAPSFTKDDAEYALKIAALADRGAYEGEREAAQGKLEGLAKGFGMGAEEMVERARKMCPYADLTAHEAAPKQAGDQALAIREEMLAPFKGLPKDELLNVIFDLLLQLGRKST